MLPAKSRSLHSLFSIMLFSACPLLLSYADQEARDTHATLEAQQQQQQQQQQQRRQRQQQHVADEQAEGSIDGEADGAAQAGRDRAALWKARAQAAMERRLEQLGAEGATCTRIV